MPTLEVKDFSDAYLLSLKADYDKMLAFAEKQRAHPKFAERINSGSIPAYNPVFLSMKSQVETEITNRGLKV